MKKQIKSNRGIRTVFVVFVVVLIIIIFILSLGKVSSVEGKKIPKDFRDSRFVAKERHAKLIKLLERRKALKFKLDRKFKIAYFFVRLFFVGIWLLILYAFIALDLIRNLSDALNYSEMLLLILIFLNFIAFGSYLELKQAIYFLRIRIENWVYGKYIHIEEGNQLYEIEADELRSKHGLK